jgi:unsaturated chondroitin disaccharide hydrolase
MQSIPVQIGESVTFEKTVGESDVYLFAGITGDFSGNHVSAAFMRTSKYGQRIAHGALLVGFMSTTSTRMLDVALARGYDGTPVSLGYDRIRFLAPVFFGDTVLVTYKLIEVDNAQQRTRAAIEVRNERSTLVAVGEHVMKWLPRDAVAAPSMDESSPGSGSESRAARQGEWRQAADAMLQRIDQTAGVLHEAFPHWANGRTGEWTTTPDGDWTGGAWPGMLWLAHAMTGDEKYRELARAWCRRLRPRAARETVFNGFGFYCGAALGDMLSADATGKTIALEAAASLRRQFDPRLGLIPLGKDAEEAGEIGKAFSSIDSLQASSLLFWAAARTGEDSWRDCAARHTTRVLDIHCRPDGSIIQSSELDARNGDVVRHFTHKGVSASSVWGRAQAWGMLYSAMGFMRSPGETRWLERSMAAADWWLAHVPDDRVAFWDFDDPAIPHTERDTAATSITCAALLKLAEVAPDPASRSRYRDAAEETVRALVRGYLTPTSADDARPRGMLVGGCFNKRPDSRPHDAALNAELIFGSYFLFESLQVLDGVVKATNV